MLITDDKNWLLLTGLFPKWAPTPEESKLFRRTLSSRNAEVMANAIENFRISFRYKEPNLGGILKEYSSLMREREMSRTFESRPKVTEDEELCKAVEADKAKMLHELELLSDEQRKHLIVQMEQRPYVAPLVGKMKGDPSSWSCFARGLAWALAMELGLIAGTSLSDQPQSHNQDQG